MEYTVELKDEDDNLEVKSGYVPVIKKILNLMTQKHRKSKDILTNKADM